MQIQSRKQFLGTTDQDLEEYFCKICYDLPLEPVKCCGPCSQIYCRKCSSNWKSNKNKCPLSCSPVAWKFQLISSLKLNLVCPYSNKCKIEHIQQMLEHIQICPYLPQIYQAFYSKKFNYLCDKSHSLQFFVGTYQEMVNSICDQCKQKEVCRSKCAKCDLKYCVKCRIPPCTKASCPIGHQYNFLHKPSEYYVCDMCGIVAAFTGKSVYDDSQCNFGICQYCYAKLPQQIDVKLNKLLKLQAQNICKNSHTLAKMQIPQIKVCQNCQKEVMCHKICTICNIYYCFNCKLIKLKNNCCDQKHQFMYRMTDDKCNMCNSNKDGGLAVQEICQYSLCLQCMQYLASVQSDKNRFKTYVQCSDGHLLKYYTSSEHQLSNCFSCKKWKINCLFCSMCKNHPFYCFQCRPTNLQSTCYLDHELEKNQKYKFCYVCQKQMSDIWRCQSCKFNVCKTCMKSKQSHP